MLDAADRGWDVHARVPDSRWSHGIGISPSFRALGA